MEKAILDAAESGDDEHQVPNDIDILPFVQQMGDPLETNHLLPSSSDEHQCDTYLTTHEADCWVTTMTCTSNHFWTWTFRIMACEVLQL